MNLKAKYDDDDDDRNRFIETTKHLNVYVMKKLFSLFPRTHTLLLSQNHIKTPIIICQNSATPLGVHIFISIIVTSVHSTARTPRPSVGRGNPNYHHHQQPTHHYLNPNPPEPLYGQTSGYGRNGRRRVRDGCLCVDQQRGRIQRQRIGRIAVRLGSLGRPAGHLDEHVSVRLPRRTYHVSRQTYRREVSIHEDSFLCGYIY